MDTYTGYQSLICTEEMLAQIYEKRYSFEELKDNQYLILKSIDGTVIDKMKFQDGELKSVKFKKIDSDYLGKLDSKNLEQDLAFDMLQDKTTPVKILAGRYGSGKSLLMIAHALDLLERGKIDKIVFIRNNIELKDTVALGSLPGTSDEKMLPYAMNLADHLGGVDAIKMMLEKGTLEIAPLGYLRGRDFKRCVVFCDECENLTTHQCQLLIGRIGENSQLWMAGDCRQTDKTVFEKDSGMTKMIERLQGNRLFSYVYLSKTERSATAALADLLD